MGKVWRPSKKSLPVDGQQGDGNFFNLNFNFFNPSFLRALLGIKRHFHIFFLIAKVLRK